MNSSKRAFALLTATALLCWPVVWSPVVHADEMLGSDLESFCNATDPQAQAACRFYILGIVQGTNLGVGLAKQGPNVCIPSDLGQDEMVATVKSLLRSDFSAYPADRDLSAPGLIMATLLHRHPCPG